MAIATIKTKLSHIKIYLQEAWNINVFINFFKGKSEDRRPHVAYKEEDVLDFINALQIKA